MSKLKKSDETKGSLRLHGIVVGKDNPRPNSSNGYKEGEKNNRKYRALRFLIKTSKTNLVPVEIFGMEQDYAYAYNKGEGKTKKISFSKRDTEILPEGYQLITPDYDKVKIFNENFKDGDAVCVVGEIQFSEYQNTNDGSIRMQQKQMIKEIYNAKKPIDIEDENHVEDSIFTQELIINSIKEDRQEKKLIVSAYTIDYKGANPAYLEVFTEKEGLTDKEEISHQKFVKSMKTLKYGDFIKVNGIIHFRAIQQEVSDDDGWGVKLRTTTTYNKVLEIIGAYGETLVQKKYKEEELLGGSINKKDKQESAKKLLDTVEKMGDNEEEDVDDLPF